MQKHEFNEYADYAIIDDIFHITYKDNIVLNLPAAVQIVKDRLSIQEGRFMPVLCDIRKIKSINKAARGYLSIEGSILVTAVAFIIDSPVSEMLSEFYLKTSKPPIPTRSFNNVQDALLFLKEFK